MRYISTRGGISPIAFKPAVMMGLATDGGLLLPEVLPKLDPETLNGHFSKNKTGGQKYKQRQVLGQQNPGGNDALWRHIF